MEEESARLNVVEADVRILATEATMDPQLEEQLEVDKRFDSFFIRNL